MSGQHQMMMGSAAPAGGGGGPFGGLVSTTNLVEWWSLSEASGTRAGAHAGLDLTDNNTVTGAAGNNGSDASLFTASNAEFLSRTSEAALQTGDIDFTFSLWIYPIDSTGAHILVGKDGGTPPALRDYMVYQNNLTAVFAVFVGAVQKNVSISGLSTGSWHFICGWHDSSADTIYVDVNDSGSPASLATGGSLDAATASPFNLGRRPWATTELYYSGRMQRVGFWKRVLTAGERTALYNSGNGLDY